MIQIVIVIDNHGMYVEDSTSTHVKIVNWK